MRPSSRRPARALPIASRLSTRARPETRRAFTLIELLTVIAIIGILAAIIIPTVGTVRAKAQRAVDGNNLREILKAAQIYAQDNNDRLPDPQALATTFQGSTAVYRWPGILAKNGILLDPSFYFAKNDPLAPATAPTVILRAGVTAKNQLDPTFTASTMSWEFVGGLKMSDPATTPVAFTRGLTTGGTWNVSGGTQGVYSDTGGYIAFLGGNVVFYPNTTTIFTSNGNGNSKPTNILQSLPMGSSTANRARVYATNATIGTAAGTLATQGP
ncbi:MAG TPA: prepilin-type N-terminal cleavage/methylation domain-containing protein [Opitutaceae bacterium]|nr:prepilin-type N-terminal cleavage/methylation domain-containing protein [Opitutaceae bacterium]